MLKNTNFDLWEFFCFIAQTLTSQSSPSAMCKEEAYKEVYNTYSWEGISALTEATARAKWRRKNWVQWFVHKSLTWGLFQERQIALKEKKIKETGLGSRTGIRIELGPQKGDRYQWWNEMKPSRRNSDRPPDNNRELEWINKVPRITPDLGCHQVSYTDIHTKL